MTHYIARHARSLDEALAMVNAGVANIISRIPLMDMERRAGRVRHGLVDFDGTLTPGSQWNAMVSLLPPNLHRMHQENYTWYHKHIHDSQPQGFTIDDDDWWVGHMETGNKLAVDGAWVSETVHLLRQAGVTREQIRQIAKTAPPREGVGALMELFTHKAVVSFGIEQFIQDWLKHNDVIAQVAATRIIFDDSNRVQRAHLNIVGSGSKQFVAERFQYLTHIIGQDLLVLGDSVVDLSMMGPETFNVLMVPPSELDNRIRDFRENNLHALWPHITLILADDSLAPLAHLLREARQH